VIIVLFCEYFTAKKEMIQNWFHKWCASQKHSWIIVELISLSVNQYSDMIFKQSFGFQFIFMAL